MAVMKGPGVVVNPGGPSAPGLVMEAGLRGVLRVLPINRVTIPVAATAIDALARLRPEPQGIDREQVVLGGFRLEIVRPAGAARTLRHGAVLYVHGGGFTVYKLHGLRTHRPVVAALARRTELPVVNVEYRQLPVTSVADSVTDCLTAYQWLLQHGVDPARIVVAGDSAGGFLAFSMALRALGHGLPAPAGLLGLSPLLDLDHAAKQAYEHAATDAYLPLSALAGLLTKVRIGAERDGTLDPVLSPVDAELTGLPPVLLIAAEREMLRHDSELMASKLTAAGVPNSLELWRGVVHDFMCIAPGLPESRGALARASRFIRARVAESEQARTA
ncbi:alpha/beta hydrolase [Nocardia donostiensis]|uniref:Esterase n=1 Tax=Nocardia donostiensis TaxID=1538463 RepID=A0A1W0B4S9_9NOCA|nr:alpha/beta hydrolase [Nocardia donostiensis]ONM46442.1 esterase [Nocardia donostiensis]OQS17535.1 esterase [Nocardia donostiensis]